MEVNKNTSILFAKLIVTYRLFFAEKSGEVLTRTYLYEIMRLEVIICLKLIHIDQEQV